MRPSPIAAGAAAFAALRIAALAVALAGGTARAQQPTAPELPQIRLIRATNFVEQLRAGAHDPRSSEVLLATKLACDGLTALLADARLAERLKAAATATAQHDELHRALRGSLERFLDEFLSPELALLQRAGLSDVAIVQIVRDADELRARDYIGKYRAGSDEPLAARLAVFAQEVCVAAGQARAIADAGRRDALTRLGLGLGGAAVVAVDLYFTAPTSGLATASYGFGTTLLGGAFVK